jgi:hypothetical protein
MNDYSTNYYKQSSYKQKLYDNYPTFPSNVYGLDTTKNKITMQICFLRVCSFVRSPRARHLPLHSTYPEVSHPLPSLLGVRFLMGRAGLQCRGQVRSGQVPPFEFNSSDPSTRGCAGWPAPALRAAVKPGSVNCRAPHRNSK